MSPAEVKATSVWELSVAVDGWVAANTPSEGMSATEADELWAWMQAKDRVH